MQHMMDACAEPNLYGEVRQKLDAEIGPFPPVEAGVPNCACPQCNHFFRDLQFRHQFIEQQTWALWNKEQRLAKWEQELKGLQGSLLSVIQRLGSAKK